MRAPHEPRWAGRTPSARGLPVWGVLAITLLLGCSGGREGSRLPALRQPSDSPGRTEGCIDTPFIAGDERATPGIQCGRSASSEVTALGGQVRVQSLPGLPGAGVEGLAVSVHSLGDGAVNLATLGPPLAETRTGAQGRFSLLARVAGEFLLVVRDEPGGRLLAAQRLPAGASEDQRSSINLVVELPSPDGEASAASAAGL